jgi:uncharacterized protein YoxC
LFSGRNASSTAAAARRADPGAAFAVVAVAVAVDTPGAGCYFHPGIEIMQSTSSALVTVLAVAVIAGVLFMIPVLLELRRAVRTLNSILKVTEESLAPTLHELRATLVNLDRITTDISTVTDDVRVFSGSIRQVGKDVRELSGLINVLGGGVGAKVAGLRAGVGAGVSYLAKNLLRKRGTT